MTRDENDRNEGRLTRRESLLRLAGAAAAVGGGAAWRLTTAEAAGSGSLAVSRGIVQCVLTPELTEGPYYVADEKVRRDITEGKAGRPLLLGLRVIKRVHVQGREERVRRHLALRRARRVLGRRREQPGDEPAAVTRTVYARAPYSRHGTSPDTTNAADSIYRNGGNKGLLSLEKSGAGYLASISMGVHV